MKSYRRLMLMAILGLESEDHLKRTSRNSVTLRITAKSPRIGVYDRLKQLVV